MKILEILGKLFEHAKEKLVILRTRLQTNPAGFENLKTLYSLSRIASKLRLALQIA